MFATGKLIINEFGNGFININDKSIYINKKDLNKAFHGEEVTVEYTETDSLFYGKVINYSLVNKTFVGYIHHFYKDQIYVYCSELGKSNLIITKSNQQLNKNIWIKVRVIDDLLNGEIIKILPNDLDIIIQEKFHLNILPNYHSNIQDDQVTDLTHLDTFTIDPENSRDCDDAFSIQKFNNDYYIYVHISDVSHWIKPTDELFDIVCQRGNTFYGKNKNWSMIPPNMANDLCSILPNKKTYVVTNKFMYSNNELHYLGYEYSIIESKNKYSYEYVDKHFDLEKFKIIYETSLLLKKEIKDIVVTNESNSHSMVKYWMLKVNNLICSKINKIYRCHSQPTKIHLLKEYFKFKNINIDLQNREQLINHIDTNDSLMLYLVKSILPKASYKSQDEGHYGIGMLEYTHWTSPIRRSCDLINQCLLRGYDFDYEKYINYMNEAETKQQMIEDFIMDINSKNSDKSHDGIIIGVSQTGIVVFIPELDNKFTIHISKLSTERLVYDKETNTLTNNSQEFKLFDKINIKIN
jgi:ribonuclease R